MVQEFAQLFPSLIPKLILRLMKKAVTLTEEVLIRLKKILGMGNIYEQGIKYLHHLEQALRAEALFKRQGLYCKKQSGDYCG